MVTYLNADTPPNEDTYCHLFSSVWTIDLCHLLWHCGIRIRYSTITIGVDPGLSDSVSTFFPYKVVSFVCDGFGLTAILLSGFERCAPRGSIWTHQLSRRLSHACCVVLVVVTL